LEYQVFTQIQMAPSHRSPWSEIVALFSLYYVLLAAEKLERQQLLEARMRHIHKGIEVVQERAQKARNMAQRAKRLVCTFPQLFFHELFQEQKQQKQAQKQAASGAPPAAASSTPTSSTERKITRIFRQRRPREDRAVDSTVLGMVCP